MYTIDKYINDTLALSNSLVIKVSDVGIQINKYLLELYNIPVPSDKHEWKYYLNMSGQKHVTNNDVEIYIIETRATLFLTVSILEQYPLTRAALLAQGEYYTELLLKYPDDEGYIKGCALPVDIDTAIEAQDGTVLNYYKNLVGPQERIIIRNITDYCKNYLSRWHIREYMITDELYLAGMLAIMYGSLPGFILSKRMDNINTALVDSFHLEHFFRSNKDIWEEVSVLNSKSKIWLYNNLKYLIKNTGKDSTLDIIIDKIFGDNSVGIGKLTLVVEEPIVADNTADISQPYYTINKSKMLSSGVNDSYILDNNNILTVEDIITAELTTLTTLDTDVVGDNAITYGKRYLKDLLNSNHVTQDTKVYDINTVKLFSITSDDLMQMVIEQWALLAFAGTYNNVNTFIDPNTKLEYVMDPKQAFIFLLHLFLDINDSTDQVVDEIFCYNLINYTLTYDDMIKNTLSTTSINQVANIMYGLKPTDSTVTTPILFKDRISEMVAFNETTMLLSANVQNMSLEADITRMSQRIINQGSVPLIHKTTTEYLGDSGITVVIDENYNYRNTIVSLIETFTGVSMDRYLDSLDYTNKFVSLFNKLTTYTTQVVQPYEDSRTISAIYRSVNVNNVPLGAITVIEGSVKQLEDAVGELVIKANNFNDRIYSIPMDNEIIFQSLACSKNPTGEVFVQEHELYGNLYTPDYQVEWIEDCQ